MAVLVAGLPVLAIVQLWGGIEMALLLYHLVSCLLVMLATGAICIWMSSECKTPFEGITLSGIVLIGFAQPLLTLIVMTDPYGVLLDADPLWRWLAPLGAVIIYLLVALGFCSLTAKRLRHLRNVGIQWQTVPVATIKRRRRASRPRGKRVPTPPLEIGANALRWKECWFDTPLGTWRRAVWATKAARMRLLGFVVFFAIAGPFYWWMLRLSRDRYPSDETFFAIAIGFVYVFSLGAVAFGIPLLSTRCIAREREMQTLEALLLLPCERREILWEKAWGCIDQPLPIVLLNWFSVLFGLGCGLISPGDALFAIVLPLPFLLAFWTTGVFLSVRCRTVLQANLVFAILLLLALAGQIVHLNFSDPLYLVAEEWGISIFSDIAPLERLLMFDLVACCVLSILFGALAYRRFTRSEAA